MINKLSLRTVSVLLTIVITCTYGFSWDEVGHKLSASIAWQHMTPEVRATVFKILMSAPEDSDLNVVYNAFNSRSKSIKKHELFMYASTWSDVIRNRAFEVRNKKYNHSNWHYADIFWMQKDGKGKILKNFNGSGGLAIPQLYLFEKTLRDPNKNDEEKAIALAWFLHVGGDIHNPLHNASRVTNTEPKGDQGGNLFVLRKSTPDRRGFNLHSYWDSIIGNVIPRKHDACDSAYLFPIARKMMKKYPYKKMQTRLKLGNYKAWSMEGYEFLKNQVYTSEITRNHIPSKKYRKKAFTIAREQIALAGYRLGETLNKIFKPKMATAANPTACKIIRNVLFPVSKRRKPKQKMRLALLDICPPNKGLVARPMTALMVEGKSIMYEYDVIRVFKDMNEAKHFAKTNKITDTNYK